MVSCSRLLKAMVFPVVMYGCESWTIKKAECRRINLLNCGVGEDREAGRAAVHGVTELDMIE